jgi:hypothetical protein
MFPSLSVRTALALALVFSLPLSAQDSEGVFPEGSPEAAPALFAGESGEASEPSSGAAASLDEGLAGPSLSLTGDPADAIRLGGADSSATPGLRVDLYSASSYVHDSNTAQMAGGPSASLFAFAFGANVRSREENVQGGYYGIDYKGQYFLYEDAAAAFGRDPFEHFVGASGGINGGFTRIRLDLDYHRNNGNAFQWDRVQRETRRARSNDLDLNLGVSRTLQRGTLELGAGYNLRDFDDDIFFNDGESTHFDAAWMTTPSFAPKSDIGLGLRLGTDNFDGNGEQDYYTPSVRWRWRVSGKTSVHNSLGYETRSIQGGSDVGNFVFNGGIEWAATARTGVGLGYYRQVQPSFLLNGQSIASTGVNLMVNNHLPGRFLLSSRIGVESADYFVSGAAGGLARTDDFVRLAFDLSHPMKLSEKLLGEIGVFYNHNRNDSNIAAFGFDQDLFGLRFALVY